MKPMTERTDKTIKDLDEIRNSIELNSCEPGIFFYEIIETIDEYLPVNVKEKMWSII